MNRVLVKCPLKYYSYLIKKLLRNHINIVNYRLKNNNYYFEITESDYDLLKTIDYKKVIIFVKYKGPKFYFYFFQNNIFNIIISLGLIIILFFSNRFIFKVNVHTNDNNLKKLIIYSLSDYNIKDYSIYKNRKYVEKVKEKILSKYNDEIEWLEVNKNGYIYDVNIIKRKKPLNKKESKRCHYIANKSGTITKIKVQRGVLLVQENNYVNSGDVLISGDIIYNDELKKEVCASGKIYGEVWYQIDLKYPLKNKKTIESKKRFNNIVLYIFGKKYYIFKNKFDVSKNSGIIGNKLFGISIEKNYDFKYKYVYLDEQKGVNLALKKVKKNIAIKSHNKSKIIAQNILKKYRKNDTIYMKVLLTVEEELGVVENY